jgi:hypothetical protein
VLNCGFLHLFLIVVDIKDSIIIAYHIERVAIDNVF